MRILTAFMLIATSAQAEVTVGAVLSLTGPSAGLGIPEARTLELLPREIAGQAVRFVVLDDASDPAQALRVTKKLIEEEHVDAILGPSNTPNSVAILATSVRRGCRS